MSKATNKPPQVATLMVRRKINSEEAKRIAGWLHYMARIIKTGPKDKFTANLAEK